jgi:sialate O-acetylesterase
MHKLRLACGIMMVVGALLAEARADVSLPKFFTDNMMLQRDKAIRVWGWAAPGEEVQVALAGKMAATKADDEGRWSTELPAMKGGEKLELTVTGKNTITLKNVIVGDIWLCSGHANMWIGLGDYDGCPVSLNAAEDCKTADFPQIRAVRLKHVTSNSPAGDCDIIANWEVCSPQTAARITAAGFYFAREIFGKTGVPIGIVDVSWSGTPIDSWVPQEGMEAVPELKDACDKRQKVIADYCTLQVTKYLEDSDRWIAATRESLAKGTTLPMPPGNFPTLAGSDNWCSRYNAMVNPLIHLPIKGALWYPQDEANGAQGDAYYDKMRALVAGWRKNWGQGDFPFYSVQLAALGEANEDPAGGDGCAKVRCAQARALAIPNTGMAVSIDLVEKDKTHPIYKCDVGLRLARWALARDYGQKDRVVSGPIFKELKIEGDKARISFGYTGSGLIVGKKEGLAPTIEDKEGKLKRFALAGEDKKWHWADAVIDGHSVVVSSPDVKNPVAVRYAFSGNPAGANLYNREGLPASPFRTDDW